MPQSGFLTKILRGKGKLAMKMGERARYVRPESELRLFCHANISCDVKNCVYHDGETFCTADHISIGPIYARSFKETACATFRPKHSDRF